MFVRCCLYGFLKNQRYFEPFLILLFLERGLTFFEIGLLVATRELATNLLELASGALADTWGRRRSMVLSFVSYLISFLVFALSEQVVLLVVAMALYGAGDAFRSGTHKAMILTWLRLQGREDERTAVYGTTRSWSKIGSALGVLGGALWVLLGGSYTGLFWLAMAPYLLDTINLATYPSELEGTSQDASLRGILRHLLDTLRQSWRKLELRGLILESSGFMGAYKASHDYLQPVLLAAATTSIWSQWLPTDDPSASTALLVAPVYIALYLGSAAMSRRAKDLVARAGSEDDAARWLWWAFSASFTLLLASAILGWYLGLIAAFLCLAMLEAVWRPVIVSRFDDHGEEEQGATLLSIESQARSLTTLVLAPALGAAVDAAIGSGLPKFLPVALCGLVIGLVFSLRARQQ